MSDDEKYSRMAMLTLGLAIGSVLGVLIGVFGWTWVAIFPCLLAPLLSWLDKKSVRFRNGVDYE